MTGGGFPHMLPEMNVKWDRKGKRILKLYEIIEIQLVNKTFVNFSTPWNIDQLQHGLQTIKAQFSKIQRYQSSKCICQHLFLDDYDPTLLFFWAMYYIKCAYLQNRLWFGKKIFFLIFESKKKFSAIVFKRLKQPRKLSVALDQTMVYFLALN